MRNKNKAEKKEIERDYLRSLNLLVDKLFQVAFDQGLAWCEMARRSGLGDETIRRLGNRETKFPQLRTVELLANSLGGRIDYLNSSDRKAITIKWTPKQLSGRYKQQKLKIA